MDIELLQVMGHVEQAIRQIMAIGLFGWIVFISSFCVVLYAKVK